MNDVFVSCSFDQKFDVVFKTIQNAAADRHLRAVRIDRDSYIGDPITDSIRQKIRESRVLVADLTGANANVLNEVGFAQALGKPLILITQDSPTDAPFNVRGLRIHKYNDADLARLYHIMATALAEATSPNELLRAMILPSSLGRPSGETWYVIAASPLSWRRATNRQGGYPKLRRTASDYVGIRGILQTFGLLYGSETLPDNIDPDDCDDPVIEEPMNLYCIASPKANRWTRAILEQYQQRWMPTIEFRADSSSPDLKNIRVSIFRDGNEIAPPGWDFSKKGDRYYRDYGLVLRGPNPYHPDHMVTIMAGRSSLGTEAACRAFTDPKRVPEINKRLAGLGIDLENHKQPFWALAKMERAIGDGKEEALPDSLEIGPVEGLTARR